MPNEPIKQGYKLTEIGVIPDDWECVKLGELFVFKNGLNKSKDFFGYGTPIVNYMDVFKNSSFYSYNIQGRVFLTNQEINNFEVKKGDVFFTRTSETSEEVGIASVILDEPLKTVFSGFILRARPINDKLNDKFKAYCLRANIVRKQIISKASCTTRALTNGRILSAVLIPVPPIAQQEKIAEVLTDIDELIESLEELINKKRLIKQGAMQELLTGKRRLKGFGENKSYKQTELGLIPEDWEVKRLYEIAEIITGSTPPTNDYSNYGNEFLFVSPVDMGKSKYIKSTEKKLSYKGFYLSRKFPFNTILFVCIGSTIGKCAIASEEMTANQQINGILPSLNFISEYLYYLLLLIAPTIKVLAGEQAVPIVNKTQFGETLIVLPPTKEEQGAIASILTDMDREIEGLEEKLEKYRQIKQGMMEELLTGKIRL